MEPHCGRVDVKARRIGAMKTKRWFLVLAGALWLAFGGAVYKDVLEARAEAATQRYWEIVSDTQSRINQLEGLIQWIMSDRSLPLVTSTARD
jgi:hypothetical protein